MLTSIAASATVGGVGRCGERKAARCVTPRNFENQSDTEKGFTLGIANFSTKVARLNLVLERAKSNTHGVDTHPVQS